MSDNDYRWLTGPSKEFLERDYLLPGQSVDERVREIAEHAGHILGDPNFADKFRSYVQKGWYSLSTPIWTNFGTMRGLPISCFGSYLEDDMASILEAQAEVGMMTKYGGGTSGYFGNLRGRGAPITNNGHSSGSVHFMQLFDSLIGIVSQGSTRRGSFAGYLDIDHPDIDEFLSIKSEGAPIQDMWFGVCVSDDWMNQMIDGDPEKRRIWARVLQSRSEVGGPYIFFTDNVNKGAPDVYRDNGYQITHSNLCSEICLPSSPTESFVCCLSSMNVEYFDEWKDTDAVEVLTFFLDSVISSFVDMSDGIKYLERAREFAKNHRAIGIGWLGWHSYLQSKMVPWESMEAKLLNTEVGKNIRLKANAASVRLAEQYGEPPVLRGYGRRNTTLMAIAPTKSSAFIIGQTSEGIEPHRSNFYLKDLAKGKFRVKNKFLEALLEEKGLNTEEIWDSILRKGGSVQHLSGLSPKEKDVFKTFSEISPREILIQASQRQKYLDQSQSLNLMIHPDTPAKDLNNLVIEGWNNGIKTLYYQQSINAAQQFARDFMESCISCES